MQFGANTYMGVMKQDDVCLSNYQGGSYCAYDFPFFLIDKVAQGSTQGYDGILGLAPASYQNGPSFVKYLADARQI